MLLENFQYFALRYLDDWCADDRRYFEGMQPTRAPEERREALCKAAKYYKVMRTLPTRKGEKRLAGALAAIDDVGTQITDATVDDAVDELTKRLKKLYGRIAVSAASKFLWLRHRSPVVILDNRATQCLWKSDCSFDAGDYPAYRKEWRRKFARRESEIRTACEGLGQAKNHSLAAAWSDREFDRVTSSPWFHERVFDKYLWWNSGGA